MARRNKTLRQANKKVGEVTGFIDDNPVTSAVAALAAGATLAAMFKMNVERTEARAHRLASERAKTDAAQARQSKKPGA